MTKKYFCILLPMIVLALSLTACNQEEIKTETPSTPVNLEQAEDLPISSSASKSKSTQEHEIPNCFYAEPNDAEEALFYQELCKTVPIEPNTVNILVPITFESISDGTQSRIFSFAYWGQFKLKDGRLMQHKAGMGPYEFYISYENGVAEKMILENLCVQGKKTYAGDEIVPCTDAEQLLKRKLTESLDEKDRQRAFDFLEQDTDYPEEFLNDIRHLRQEENDKINAKIQNTVQQYLHQEGITVEGYTILGQDWHKGGN